MVGVQPTSPPPDGRGGRRWVQVCKGPDGSIHNGLRSSSLTTTIIMAVVGN